MAKSNKQNSKPAVTASAQPVAAAKPFSFGEKESHLWMVTLLAFIGFYWYSTKSTGYYQDDEISHFLSMLGFWDDPKSIMGNWSKPGYKLLYVLPAKLGYNFVLLLNCAISALGCWLAGKTAGHFIKGAAIPAIIFAALQPVWIELSFRNYADILSGVLMIGSVYLALKEKWLFSSLLLSYNILVRQELLILLFIFGIYLFINRKWIPMLALGLFPLLYALWTMQAQGDFWYMITEAQATSAAYAKEYPKQGLWHYPLMAAVCFGAMQLAPVVVFLYMAIKMCIVPDNKVIATDDNTIFRFMGGLGKSLSAYFKKLPGNLLMVAVPFLVFFVIHCIFNMKEPEMGPATGGNLRYMTAVSPLIGAMASLAFLYMKRPSKTELYILLGVFGVLVLAFMCFDHEYLKFKVDPKSVANAKDADEYDAMKEYVKDFFPILFYIAGALLFFLPLKGWLQIAYIAGLGLIFVGKEVHPYKLSPENSAVKQCVEKIGKQKPQKDKTILSNHGNVWFYWLLANDEQIKNKGTLDSASIKKAPVGSLMIWDTHYGYRPNRTPGSVPSEYFNNDSFKFLQPLMVSSKDQRFQIAVFEKVK